MGKTHPDYFKNRRQRPDIRAANTAYLLAIRTARREFVSNYKRAKGCLDCGEKDPVVLEFDHRDRRTKDFTISHYMKCKIEVLKTEMEKCDVRCANCHRRKTHRENLEIRAGVDNSIPLMVDMGVVQGVRASRKRDHR